MAIHKSQDEDTETYSRAHFGQRVGFGHVFAVLVVDMSRAFTSDSYSVGHRDDRLVESVGVLLNEARKAGCPIIYTTTSYSDPEQAGYWGVKIPGLTELRDSDPNTRLIHEELAPRAEDVVINKHYSSAFFGTDLNALLAFRRIDTLIIAGCSTSGCVRATVMDAVSNGYRVVVPRSAVGDRARAPHEATMFDIDAKYGDVMDDTVVYSRLREVTR